MSESVAEVKKMNFPKSEEVINATIIIIAFSLIMAAFLGVVDIFSGAGVKWIINTADWPVTGQPPEFEVLRGILGETEE